MNGNRKLRKSFHSNLKNCLPVWTRAGYTFRPAGKCHMAAISRSEGIEVIGKQKIGSPAGFELAIRRGELTGPAGKAGSPGKTRLP